MWGRKTELDKTKVEDLIWEKIKTKLIKDKHLQNEEVITKKGENEIVNAIQFGKELKQSYKIDEIKDKFRKWINSPERKGRISDKEGKQSELADLFLQTHFVCYAKKTPAEYERKAYELEADAKIRTDRNPEFLLGVKIQRTSPYGDPEQSVGVQYSTSKKISVEAKKGGFYIQQEFSKEKETRIGINESAFDVFVKKTTEGFGLVAGFATGPFSYGYDFLKKQAGGGINWWIAGFEFINKTIQDAQKESKQRGFWGALGHSVYPLALGLRAIDILIVNPYKKIRDMLDWALPHKTDKAKKIMPDERKLEKISESIALDNLHTAKRQLVEMLANKLNPIVKAEVQIQLDMVEYKLARRGFPRALNIFNFSTLFKSKKELANQKIFANVDESIKRLGELSAKKSIAGRELDEFIYHYTYLASKTKLEPDKREGFPIPESPLPFKSHNSIMEVLGKAGKKIAKLYEIRTNMIIARIEGKNFEGALAYRDQLNFLAKYSGHKDSVYFNRVIENPLNEFMGVVDVLNTHKNIAPTHISKYVDLKGMADKDLFSFYQNKLIEMAKADPQSFLNTAKIINKEIQKLRKKKDMTSKDEGDKILQMKAILEIEGRAEIMQSKDKKLYDEIRKNAEPTWVILPFGSGPKQ